MHRKKSKQLRSAHSQCERRIQKPQKKPTKHSASAKRSNNRSSKAIADLTFEGLATNGNKNEMPTKVEVQFSSGEGLATNSNKNGMPTKVEVQFPSGESIACLA